MQEPQETQVGSLDWEDPLEEGTATHSSILAWRIPWWEKPGRLAHRVGAKSRTWQKRLSMHTCKHVCSLTLHTIQMNSESRFLNQSSNWREGWVLLEATAVTADRNCKRATAWQQWERFLTQCSYTRTPWVLVTESSWHRCKSPGQILGLGVKCQPTGKVMFWSSV